MRLFGKFSLTVALAFLFVFKSFSQCEEGRYQGIIFTDNELHSDILYGSNVNYLGLEQDLFLDVYEPTGDEENSRPLIIFAHGGSFISGSKIGPDVVPFCKDFARMGYVTASIQYRIGINPFSADPLEQNATSAVIRGFHDMKAAIRFFRKSVEEDGNPYGINSSEIYLAGVSAGGFITLHNAYLDQESEFPEIVDQTQTGLTGGIEGDSGNSGFDSSIKGIINIAGALSDTTIMNGNTTPVCSFHGTGDTVVPFDSDVQTVIGLEVTEVDGSNSIHIKANELGITNCFEIYEFQGHVPHVDNQLYYDTTRAIMTSFLAHLVCPDIDLDCEYNEIFIVGQEELSSQLTLNIYPNPSSEKFNVVLPETKKSSTVSIFDLNGRLLKLEHLMPHEQTFVIDARTLRRGIYSFTWESGEKFEKRKLVVN